MSFRRGLFRLWIVASAFWAGEHRRIGRDAGKRAVDHTSQNSLALRVARHGTEETVEVAAAWRRAAGRFTSTLIGSPEFGL